MKQPLFIDTDAGVDDLMAIGLIVLSGKFDITGISIVNGVATVRKGVMNIRRVLESFGCTAPVFAGVSQRAQGSSVQFPQEDRKRANDLALLSTPLPGIEHFQPSSKSAINRAIRKAAASGTLLCLGPLSNIARARPSYSRDSRLVIMGGAVFTLGNVAPAYAAEYNIRLDAAAARAVFDSPADVTLVPTDATRFVPAVPTAAADGADRRLLAGFIADIRNTVPPTRAGAIVKEIILNNAGDFASFYDPLAAAILIDPTIVREKRRGDVSVSLSNRALGKTVFSARLCGFTTVVTAVNAGKFYSLAKYLIAKP